MGIMSKPISDMSFKVMFQKIDREFLDTVLKSFSVSESDYKDALREELFIPGMTNSLAWTAIQFIEEALFDDSIVDKSMRGIIRYCILLSGISEQCSKS